MNRIGFATEDQLLAFAAGGEQMVARVRLVLVLCVFAIPVMQMLLLGRAPTELLIGLAASGAALVLATIFLALSRVPRFEMWLPYASSISDVSLVSAALVGFMAIGAPMVAVNSRVVWEIYLLAIAATALRPRRRVAVLTTLVALAQYLLIVLYADWRWSLDEPNHATLGYGSFGWLSQISRLILIAVAGLIAAAIIRTIRRITHLAGNDPLTETYNRTYFDLRIEQEVRRAQRYGHPLTLVLMDIDHFKRINDTLGHDIGDQALIRVAQCLKDGVRASDIVFRHGGDELALLMPETTAAEAHQIVQRIMQAVRAHPVAGQQLTLSAGLATLSPQTPDLEALVKSADRHLYAAKEKGRDRVVAVPA